jgi:hypothetical protein
VRRVRLHNDHVTSAGIPQRSSGRLTLHAGNAEDRPVLLAQRGNATCAVLGVGRILLSVDYPYGRSNAPVCQAGGGSSTRSNTKPLEPSPRPTGDSRPIQRNVIHLLRGQSTGSLHDQLYVQDAADSKWKSVVAEYTGSDIEVSFAPVFKIAHDDTVPAYSNFGISVDKKRIESYFIFYPGRTTHVQFDRTSNSFAEKQTEWERVGGIADESPFYPFAASRPPL